MNQSLYNVPTLTHITVQPFFRGWRYILGWCLYVRFLQFNHPLVQTRLLLILSDLIKVDQNCNVRGIRQQV